MFAQRPQRADARRNFDALLAAARDAFAEDGTDASLEDVARRAGVGIGTLYRNFPTRRDLFETVYIGEVEALRRAAEDLADAPPWDALVTWLHRFVGVHRHQARDRRGLSTRLGDVPHCRDEISRAGEPLLSRPGRRRGAHRHRLRRRGAADQRPHLARFRRPEQRDRVLGVALDGLRASTR